MAKKVEPKLMTEGKPDKPPGRPTTYLPEYCEKLVEHMRMGNSFESFGAVCGSHRDTLYEWEKVHPEFSDAKKTGKELSLKFYEDMGKMIATGQLRRVKSESPMQDSKGDPIIDPVTGKVMTRVEYEPAHPNPAAWIFLMKNLHKWRNESHVELTGEGGGPVKLQSVEGMTDEELKNKVVEMAKKALSN